MEIKKEKIMSYFIIVRGPLGSGKTTIAKNVAKETGAYYCSVDEVLEKNNLTKDKEEGYISQKSFIAANDSIADQIKTNAEHGIPTVVDGNFYWKSSIEDLIGRLDTIPHAVFTLKLPMEVCIDRDSKREKSYGTGAVEALYRKVTEFDYGINIDATQSIEQSTRHIVESMKKEVMI